MFRTWSASSVLAGELKINRISPPHLTTSIGTLFLFEKRIEGVGFQLRFCSRLAGRLFLCFAIHIFIVAFLVGAIVIRSELTNAKWHRIRLKMFCNSIWAIQCDSMLYIRSSLLTNDDNRILSVPRNWFPWTTTVCVTNEWAERKQNCPVAVVGSDVVVSTQF